jgi:hypothetical protein
MDRLKYLDLPSIVLGISHFRVRFNDVEDMCYYCYRATKRQNMNAYALESDHLT